LNVHNPPFNADWGGKRLRDDVRWNFGMPPVSNANSAWLPALSTTSHRMERPA
jgi:type I restriction-modification system DNA methylase subunit